MTALDTNILVRFFIADDAAQTSQVYKIFKQAENDNSELYVPTLVVLELLWVLDSAYQFKRDDILQALSDLTLMPIFKFENFSAIQMFIQEAQTTNFGLSDLLIANFTKVCEVNSILTFDKKAAKHPMFDLLK